MWLFIIFQWSLAQVRDQHQLLEYVRRKITNLKLIQLVLLPMQNVKIFHPYILKVQKLWRNFFVQCYTSGLRMLLDLSGVIHWRFYLGSPKGFQPKSSKYCWWKVQNLGKSWDFQLLFPQLVSLPEFWTINNRMFPKIVVPPNHPF